MDADSSKLILRIHTLTTGHDAHAIFQEARGLFDKSVRHHVLQRLQQRLTATGQYFPDQPSISEKEAFEGLEMILEANAELADGDRFDLLPLEIRYVQRALVDKDFVIQDEEMMHSQWESVSIEKLPFLSPAAQKMYLDGALPLERQRISADAVLDALAADDVDVASLIDEWHIETPEIKDVLECWACDPDLRGEELFTEHALPEDIANALCIRPDAKDAPNMARQLLRQMHQTGERIIATREHNDERFLNIRWAQPVEPATERRIEIIPEAAWLQAHPEAPSTVDPSDEGIDME
jgi:hypothetical protein